METIKRWWLLLSALAFGILYLLFDRRGRRIEELRAAALKTALANEIDGIVQQAARSGEDFKRARERYEELKRQYPGLVSSLQLTAPDESHGSGSGAAGADEPGPNAS